MHSLSIVEVAMLQAKDETVCTRYRGAPVLKAYAPPTFLGMPADEATHKDFERVLANYRENRPLTETGFRLVSDYNTLMRWASENGYRPKPYKPFPLPKATSKKDELLTPESMEAIITASDELFGDDIAIGIAIRALAWLALGVGEAANFSLEKIDYTRWEYIQADGVGRLRFIPIPRKMQALIAKARHLKPNGGHHKRENFAWLSDQGIRDIVRRIGEHCGLPGLLPTQIVHTCIFG